MRISRTALSTNHLFLNFPQYFSGNNLYLASNIAGMRDADQRIVRDVERLCNDAASLIPTMVKPVVDIVWFSSRMWMLTGESVDY